MKVFQAGAGILLVATIARSECVVVASETRPSKQNAHATVMVGGKPAARLPIHLVITSFPSGKQSEMRLATDAHGAIDLKSLPPGQNCLVADAEPRLTASMCLDVTVAHDSSPTELPLVLASSRAEPTLAELAKQHDQSPIELTGPAFVGAVKDQSGAGVTKAEITIYRRDAKTKSDPLKVQADDQGNFTAPLEPGMYTIVIMAQAFRTRFVGVEIKPDAPKQNMLVELRIESC
jgi:hypothetical protein